MRAMDTIVEFTLIVYGTEISKFMVSGASKVTGDCKVLNVLQSHVTSQRGWTTWLTGAVDKRVVAIVPVVMDELNFVKVCTSNVHSSVHF